LPRQGAIGERAARYFLFGHLQPCEQSSQHEHLHLQSGQPLQQSFPVLQSAELVLEADVPAMPVVMMLEAMSRPPNSLANIEISLSWMKN
jgi:hypothetical protein